MVDGGHGGAHDVIYKSRDLFLGQKTTILWCFLLFLVFFNVFLFGGVWCLVGACFVGLCLVVGVPGFLPSIEVALTL